LAAARPRSGQRRAGKKEGVLGVLCPQGFCPPAAIFGEFLPAVGGGLKISVEIFLIESSNFFQ